jgi:hypothetical protein
MRFILHLGVVDVGNNIHKLASFRGDGLIGNFLVEIFKEVGTPLKLFLSLLLSLVIIVLHSIPISLLRSLIFNDFIK